MPKLIFETDRPNHVFEEDGKVVRSGRKFSVSDDRAEQLLADHPDVLKRAPVRQQSDAGKTSESGKGTPDASTSAQPASKGTAAQQTGAST